METIVDRITANIALVTSLSNANVEAIRVWMTENVQMHHCRALHYAIVMVCVQVKTSPHT